jgi:hypothetical protein
MKIRLIDVLFLTVAAAVGMHWGFWLASRYGTLAGVLGFILGFIVGLAALLAFGWLLDIVSKLLRPPFPPCREGKCSSYEDYELIESIESEKDKLGTLRLCKCGGKYLMKRFSLFGYAEAWEIPEDGTSRPYMRYVRRWGILGRWEKANS